MTSPGRTGVCGLTGPPCVGHGLLCFRPCPGGLGLSFWAKLSARGWALSSSQRVPRGPGLTRPVQLPCWTHMGPLCRPQWGSGDPLQHPQGREGGGVDGRRRGHGGKGRGPAWTWPQLRGSLGVLATQPVWPRDSVGGQEQQEPSERPGG